MAYAPTVWTKNMLISFQKLNKLEGGVQAADALAVAAQTTATQAATQAGTALAAAEAAQTAASSAGAAIAAKVDTTDARLSDARTPTAHTHPVTQLAVTGTRDATTFLRGDGVWAAPPGTGGGGGTPSAHASAHAEGGADPITPALIGAASELDLVQLASEVAADLSEKVDATDPRLSDARDTTAARITDATAPGRKLLTGAALTDAEQGAQRVALGIDRARGAYAPTRAVRPADAPQVTLQPGDNIASASAAHPEGTWFTLAPGTYLGQSWVPKHRQRFGAAVRGTVTLDGQGAEWAVRTQFGENDAPSANGVVLQNLVFTGYTSFSQHGVVWFGSGGERQSFDGVVEDCDVLNATNGGGIRVGHRTRVSRCRVNGHAQLGIAGIGDDVLVEHCEVANNNAAGAFDPAHEAGGMKFTRTRRAVVRGCHVHDNRGPGIWFDVHNVDTRIEGNRSEDNGREGIFYEVSARAVIRGNTCRGNGLLLGEYAYGAGILVAHSPDVEVYDNDVAGNRNGILGLQQDRSTDAPPPAWSPNAGAHLLTRLYVHDNRIAHAFAAGWAAGVLTDVGTAPFADSAGNVFARNAYELAPALATPLAWNNGVGVTLTEFQTRYGQERAAVLGDAAGGGGGAVQSVNGETGAVVLSAADVGAVAPGDAVTWTQAHRFAAATDQIAFQPQNRTYTFRAVDAAGQFQFVRSDSGSGFYIQPDATAVKFGPVGNATLLFNASSSNGFIFCPAEAGGVGLVQFGRRFSDSNPAVGARLEVWPTTTQPATELSVGVMAPGGASVRGGLRADGSALLPGGLHLVGRTSSAAAPTTAEVPADKDLALHKNTATGAVTLAYNDGGTVKTVVLA
jgi:parallel beta-helix repeat protein